MHIKGDGVEIEFPKDPEEFTSEKCAPFREALNNASFWGRIPLLNYSPLHNMQDMSLVRFRGMIQDMHDPEIYLESYEVSTNDGARTRLQQGKYRDCLVLKADEDVNYDSKANVHGERRTLFVLSLPGINAWTAEYEEQCNQRHLPHATSTTEDHTPGAVKKRAAPSEVGEAEHMDVDVQTQANGAAASSESNKRLCTHAEKMPSTTATASLLGADYLTNSPIPERPSKACMIKIYADFDSYTLNSLVDVVGFLSVDPALDASTIDMDMCGDFESVSELQAQNPPPSLIPRMHAIAVHHLLHANPLLDARLLPLVPPAGTDLNMSAVHKDLRMLLTLCLFNDSLAADYLLSHLMSTVYNRSEMQSIGKFALNLCNFPREMITGYTKKLYDVLELLLPASHYLPMTLEKMNTSAFAPKKDYATSKLVSGLLQLAPHTHFVLDETHLEQGKLEANGVMGVQNIAQLINRQQIKCDFQYYEIYYDADIPVLVLSEGRSMLPSDFVVPLKTDAESVQLMEETLKAAHHYLQQPERLDQFRRFLTIAKTTTFTMHPEQSEMVQTDFVEMRKANLIQTADELHALLVLSRLLAIACGKPALDKESWELAKDMEAQRKQRVRELPKSSRATSAQ